MIGIEDLKVDNSYGINGNSKDVGKMQLDGSGFGDDKESKLLAKKRNEKKILLGDIYDQEGPVDTAVKTEQEKKKKDKVVITEQENWNLVA